MAVVAALVSGALISTAAPSGADLPRPLIGARTLGDPLLPQLGNGGYDVTHYGSS